MNRIITIFLAAGLFFNMVSAQKPDYDDVFASVKTLKDFEAYQVLLNYQKAFPYFANTYYQLGLICQKWMKQYDPFLQSDEVKENIRNAQLYFSLCLTYCDESDARKNREYYKNVLPAKGEEYASFLLVQQDIKNRMKDVETFKKFHNQDILSLVRCVSKYNTCISIFREINMENSRLKDLYFISDKTIVGKLNELKTNFDSATYYFQRLSSLLKEFPLGNYTPAYTLAPVQVYRLHGLTSSNFLVNGIVLWDFGSWVNSFRNVLDTDIAELNKKAYETEKMHSEYINKLKEKNTKGISSDYRMNPAFLNKIYKYDFRSALGRLFEYQEMKINYLEQNANSIPVIYDSLKLRQWSNKPGYYFQLVDDKQNTDSLLGNLKTDATEVEISKYAEFFKKHYKGYEGILQYIENQEFDNNFILAASLDDYKNNLISELKNDTIPELLKYKKIALNLNLTTPDLVKTEGYHTFSKIEMPGKEVVISGSSFGKNSDISAFVAVIDSLNTVKWLKSYKPGQASQYGIIAIPAGDGFLLTMISKSPKSQYITILMLDREGNIKSSKEINTPAVPRKILYDDINQSTLLACKGNDYGSFTLSGDSLGIFVLDATLSVTWNKKFWFEGYLSDVLKINNQFLVLGSFNTLIAPDGKDFKLAEGISNVFLSIFDADGNYLLTNTYPETFSYFPLKVVKINSDFIDVISVKEKNPGDIIKYENISSTAYYLITTTQGAKYFSY